MSTEDNKALAIRWNSDRNFVNFDTYDQYLHEDYVVYGGSEGRWHAMIRGRAGLESFYRGMLERHPHLDVVLDDVIAEGEKVAVKVTFLNQGKPIANGMGFRRFADGKVVEDWVCSTPIE